jgi:hypothetical protein
MDDEVRGPYRTRDPYRAVKELHWRQHVSSTAAAHESTRVWEALPPPAQYASWRRREQRTLADALTPWEQHAAALEAQERAALLAHGGRWDAILPRTYLEVETVPLERRQRAGGVYHYRVWSEELVRGAKTYRGTELQPQPTRVAASVDALVAAVGQAPLHPPWWRAEVFTEDHALRTALRAQQIHLGPRYSAALAQARRQFYTVEAKEAVAEALARVTRIEAEWMTYSPAQQRRAYLDAGQGTVPTLWEQRVAAHTRLDRRQRMIPQASLEGELPANFVEVDYGRTEVAPYVVQRWAGIWDAELGLTRYARTSSEPVRRVERIAELAQERQATIYADNLRVRAALRRQGLMIAVEPHLAEQPPLVDRGRERTRSRGIDLGD